MLRSKGWIVATATLLIVLGAAPAIAGPGGEGGAPAPEQLLIDAGLDADQIDYLQSEGLGYAQIYLLHIAAEFFGVEPLAYYQSLDGQIPWGKIMRLFNANFGAFLAAHLHDDA
jgi:hypothetical protein